MQKDNLEATRTLGCMLAMAAASGCRSVFKRSSSVEGKLITTNTQTTRDINECLNAAKEKRKRRQQKRLKNWGK